MPELTISPEKVGFLIEKAREFDAKDVPADPDSGSNGADDGMIDVLEDNGADPVVREITGFIDALTEDEQIDLGQRFDGLNHIRLLRRVYMTKCG